jgi:glycosyltransferase involved in cell wall biosynthesis
VRVDPQRHVLHVIVPEPPGEIGGADLHTRDLARAQLHSGWFRPLVLEVGSEEYSRRLEAEGIPLLPGSRISRRQLLRRLRDLPASWRIDIVHSHGYDADFLATALQLLFPRTWGRLPVVMTCHGLVEDTHWHRAKTRLDRWCFRRAGALVVTSRSQRDRLAGASARGPTVFVPNGVPPPSRPRRDSRARLLARYGLPPRSALIASVGRLAGEKRVDLYLRACARVTAKRDDVHFLVVGSGPELPRLRGIAEVEGLESRVTFTGLLHDVDEIYDGIDLLMIASDTEGTPRAALEAMAHGVPVVATKVGGIPDIIVDDRFGELVPQGDAARLAEAALRLLADPDRRARVAGCARRRLEEEFSIERMRERVEAVYRQVLRRGEPDSVDPGSPRARSHPIRSGRGPAGALPVLHYVQEWLPLSQSFVYQPISRSRHRAIVATRAPLTNMAAFPHRPVCSLSSIWPHAERRVPRVVLTAWLTGLAAAYGVRVIHVHFGYPIHDVAGLRRMLGLPLAVSLWGHDATVVPRQRPHHYPGALEAADAVMVPSRFLAERALALGARPASIRVIPGGVDTGYFVPTPTPDGPPIVLFVGRFVEKKGIDVLLEAWPSVVDHFPDACLRLLGDGPLGELARAPMHAVIVEAPDPYRPAEQVRAAMRRAAVVVSPSRTAADGDAESLLVVNLEAQASGRPVVTTRHGGIPEFVEEGESALVISENDPAGLAEAIIRLLDDPELAGRLGVNGPSVAAHFDIAAVTEQLDELYEDLARG